MTTCWVIIAILICWTSGTFSQIDETRDDPQIEIYKRVLRIREFATFKIETNQPLENCVFTLPGNVSHELKREDEANWPSEFTRGTKFLYSGPMKNGKCSLSVRVDENLGGIVQADVKKVGSKEATKSVLTVRVTGLPQTELPAFQIEPKKSSLLNGEIVTISCNADRPIDVCRFILPDGRELDFDQGPFSQRSEEFRYQGVGLHDGKCALRLKSGLQHNGLIVCKIGLSPLNFNGKWDSGVMIIKTIEDDHHHHQDDQLWPSKDVGRISTSVAFFSLHSTSPLQNCIFTLPTGSTFDFSQGHNSTKIGQYEGYNGLGLDKGDCGCSFDIKNTSFEGVVTCKVRKVGSSDWIVSASTLRITGLSEQALPSFEIEPRRASLRTGDTINITCNAENRPLEVCRFVLPDGSEVNFDRGPNSRLTDEYLYLGTGLANGHCGISLRVDERHNGQILCKIGKEPLTTNGKWHMGVMVIEIKDPVVDDVIINSNNDGRPLVVIKPKSTTTSRPTTVQPETDLSEEELPSFEIAPRRASLKTGDTINITCNAENLPLEVCRFVLPDGSEVNFDRGPNSRLTDEYRYLGTGLANGNCGISLRVDERHNGEIFCKIGKELLTTEEEWDMDVMTIETKDPVVDDVIVNSNNDGRPLVVINPKSTTTSRPTTVQPGTDPVVEDAVVNSNNDGRPLVVTKPKSTTTPRPTTVQPGTDCGRNHLDQEATLISGGRDTVVGEFPWHAGIYKKSGTTYVQECGGTLITSKIVLTAAHCLKPGKTRDKSLYRVGLGKHSRDWTEDPAGERVQRFTVQDIIIPTEYRGKRGKFQYDIAVVVLEEEAKITRFVDIVCMDWDSSSKGLQLAEGQVGVATGWGGSGNKTSSHPLQKVFMPWVSESECLQAIKRYKTVHPYYTTDKFCAGSLNKTQNLCKSDSGSGLFFKDESSQRYYLRGIKGVSFEDVEEGKRCVTRFYSGFVDVSGYIKDLIEPAI